MRSAMRAWLGLTIVGSLGCGDAAESVPAGGWGGADATTTATTSLAVSTTSGEGGGGSTGAAWLPLEGPRVALRVAPRADLLVGGGARVASTLDVPIARAKDRAAWTMSMGGRTIDTASSTLVIFPAVDDPSRAAAAVWRFADGGDVGAPVRATLDGTVVFEGTLGGSTAALGRVDVAPVVVHASTGEGPDAGTVDAAFQAFVPLYRDACQLELVVHPAKTLVRDGFQALEQLDMVALDDASAIASIRTETGSEAGVAMSRRMTPIFEGASLDAPPFTRVVRAVVLTQHQSSEQANAITPSYFHHDRIADLHPESPSFYPGPELDWLWIDPALDFASQTWPVMSPEERERTYAVYFGADHLEAFGHELGHLLGLPHPGDSSEIDAGPGDVGANLMDAVDPCVPGCAVRISPQQCEIVLSGMTGFVTAR